MLSFSRQLVKLVVNLTVLEQLNLVVLGTTSIVIVRYLGPELFGVLQFFSTLASIPAVFYSHVNLAIVRFVPTVSDRRKAEILLVVTGIELVIVVMVLSGGGFLYMLGSDTLAGRLSGSLSGGELGVALALIAALAPSLMLHSVLQAFIAGIQRITAAQGIVLLAALATLLAVLVIVSTVPDPTAGLLLILGTRLLGQVLGAAVCGLYLLRASRVFADLRSLPLRSWTSLSGSVYREFIKTYAQPLQIASIFTFLQENLAVLVLGAMSSMSQVAYYDIVRKIYDVPRKLVPGLVRKILPRIVLNLERDPVAFGRQFTEFTWLQLGFNALAGTLLLVLHPFLLALLRVPVEGPVFWIVFLFSVNLLLTAIAQTSGYVIQFGKDTRALMTAGIARSLLLTGASLVLIPAGAALGAAVSLVFSTLFTLALLARATRGSRLWTPADNARHALASLLVSLAWLGGYRALAARLPEHFPWPL